LTRRPELGYLWIDRKEKDARMGESDAAAYLDRLTPLLPAIRQGF
jgi:hypothetical protein